MKRENVIKMIDSYFQEIEWKYKYDSEKQSYTYGVEMGNVIGNVKFILPVEEHHYKVIGIINSKVEKTRLPLIAEYLHRANYGMNNGNFELDYRDGEVRFKTYVDFKGIELSKRIIEDSIIIPILMIDRYGKNMIKLMLEDGIPEELIKDAETEDGKEEE